jgi:hypothetical protein
MLHLHPITRHARQFWGVGSSVFAVSKIASYQGQVSIKTIT